MLNRLLTVIVAVLLILIGSFRCDPPFDCTNLRVPSTCVLGKVDGEAEDKTCNWEVISSGSSGKPALIGCTPINCALYQPGSKCFCLDGSVGDATNCQRVHCGCTVNCTAMGAICTDGADDQCHMYKAQCSKDCAAKNQRCVAPPEYFFTRDTVNTDHNCLVTQSGRCVDLTTTTTAATDEEYPYGRSLDANRPSKPYYSFRETEL